MMPVHIQNHNIERESVLVIFVRNPEDLLVRIAGHVRAAGRPLFRRQLRQHAAAHVIPPQQDAVAQTHADVGMAARIHGRGYHRTAQFILPQRAVMDQALLLPPDQAEKLAS